MNSRPPKHLTPIYPSEAGSAELVAAWPRIRAGIYDILESSPATAVTMTFLSLFRLGTSEKGDNNPKTVYVALDYDSQASTWPPILDAMQAHVDTFQMDLKVHMEHNPQGREEGLSSGWYAWLLGPRQD